MELKTLEEMTRRKIRAFLFDYSIPKVVDETLLEKFRNMSCTLKPGDEMEFSADQNKVFLRCWRTREETDAEFDMRVGPGSAELQATAKRYMDYLDLKAEFENLKED